MIKRLTNLLKQLNLQDYETVYASTIKDNPETDSNFFHLSNPDEATSLLIYLREVSKIVKNHPEKQLKRFIFIDEFADLIQLARNKKGEYTELMSLIQEIARMGRHNQVWLGVSTQNISAKEIDSSGISRGMLRTKISFMTDLTDKVAFQNTFGDCDLNLLSEKGVCYYKNGSELEILMTPRTIN